MTLARKLHMYKSVRLSGKYDFPWSSRVITIDWKPFFFLVNRRVHFICSYFFLFAIERFSYDFRGSRGISRIKILVCIDKWQGWIEHVETWQNVIIHVIITMNSNVNTLKHDGWFSAHRQIAKNKWLFHLFMIHIGDYRWFKTKKMMCVYVCDKISHQHKWECAFWGVGL